MQIPALEATSLSLGWMLMSSIVFQLWNQESQNFKSWKCAYLSPTRMYVNSCLSTLSPILMFSWFWERQYEFRRVDEKEVKEWLDMLCHSLLQQQHFFKYKKGKYLPIELIIWTDNLKDTIKKVFWRVDRFTARQI